jgi:ACT domain-containing protein
MNRTVITVIGKDTVGIIAAVCSYLADNNVNILDITQTTIREYFNMMMIVDITTLEKPFGVLSDELASLGQEKIGVQIKIQKEEIFNLMHRI